MRCQKVGKYFEEIFFNEEMAEGNIFGICVFFDFSPSRKIITYLCCVARCSLVEEMVSESFDCDVLTKMNQGMRYLSIYLSIYLSVCLSVCPSVRPACPPACLSYVTASTKSGATIGPLAKRHSDNVSLAGDSGPILRAYWGPCLQGMREKTDEWTNHPKPVSSIRYKWTCAYI